MTLLVMWLTYTAFGVTFFSLVFLWAVRSRQFSDQERARYLVLGDDAPAEVPAPSPAGRVSPVLYVPLALLLLSALLLGGAGWYVFTH